MKTPAIAACVLLAAAGALAQGKERFTAFAVDFGGLSREAGSGTVEVLVERWSTDEERRISRGTESSEYPFTIVEMRLDARGEGHGRLSLATRIVGDADRVELENYDTAPIRLTKIKARRD